MKKRLISFAAGLLCLCCLTSFAAPAASLKSADAQLTVAQAAVTKPGTVTGLKATGSGKNRVTLTWTAVSGAQGYLVYGQKSGKYAYVGMTTSGTTFTDTKALDNDYNYYWVFAYVKDASGKMIPGGCQKYVFAKGICPVVPNLKAASTTSGVKLTWSKVNTAAGYLIYGKTNSGTYGYKGMTASTTWTDTKAPSNEYSFYWVFAYHKDASGNMVVGGTGSYVYSKKSVAQYATRKVGSLTYSYATEWDFYPSEDNTSDHYFCMYFDKNNAGDIFIYFEKLVDPSKAASYNIDNYVNTYMQLIEGGYADKDFKFTSKGSGKSGDLKWYDYKFEYIDSVNGSNSSAVATGHIRFYYDLKTGFLYEFQSKTNASAKAADIAAFNKQLDVLFASIKKA
ncbi:MAG: hypothetical protein J6T40_07150 [Clostridiales bacterium]|nr:hypothetical protein [Clostridiales bacterium]